VKSVFLFKIPEKPVNWGGELLAIYQTSGAIVLLRRVCFNFILSLRSAVKPIKYFTVTGVFILATLSLVCLAQAETNLDKLCEHVGNSSCCMASLRIIKQGNFQLAENNRCPKGYKVEMQRCIDTLKWCIPDECKGVGQGASFGGVPPPGGWPDENCCAGLVAREVASSCKFKMVGGYSFVCLRCGDKLCDTNLENSCNCPEDCG
jgi:hypothetical protein